MEKEEKELGDKRKQRVNFYLNNNLNYLSWLTKKPTFKSEQNKRKSAFLMAFFITTFNLVVFTIN